MLVMTPEFIKHFILAGKIAGAVSAIGGLFYGIIRWLTSMYRKVSTIGTSIDTLTNNHLPHIQKSLDDHGTALSAMKVDIHDMDTKIGVYGERIDETKKSVDSLGTAFIQHLENASKEKIIMRKRK